MASRKPGNRFTRRLMKVLHEISTAGIMGAAAAQLLLSFYAAGQAPADFAVLRAVVLLLAQWILVPSLAVVLLTGLVALALHPPFTRAAWALIKLAMTVLVLEVTMVSVYGSARGVATMAEGMVRGEAPEAEALATAYRMERTGLIILLVLSVANIVLAVWRPRWESPSRAARSASAKRAAASKDPAPPAAETPADGAEEAPAV